MVHPAAHIAPGGRGPGYPRHCHRHDTAPGSRARHALITTLITVLITVLITAVRRLA
ncbi:MAG: hypothetical protein ACRENC_13345 [Gemmatimonadaceae bacterium]